MKKLLSILLTAALLLSCGVSAWAAEELPIDHSHTVSDIYFIVGDQILDLSGITIDLDVTGDAGSKACRLHVDHDDETVAEIGLTALDNGLYALHMDSETLGHKDYGIDPVAVMAKMLQSGIDSLSKLLQGVDVNAAAQDIIDKLTEPAPEAPEPEPTPEASPAPAVPSFSIEGEPMELIMSCIGEPETVHMGGTEFDPNGAVAEMPDGDYQVQTFTFDTDTICQLLDMVYVDGEPAGLGDKFREAGVEFLFTGTFYDGEEAHIAQISGSLSGDDFSFSAGGGYNQLIIEDGKKTTYSFGTSSGTDPESLEVFGLSFTVSDAPYYGELFTSGDPSGDDLIMLSDMEQEEAVSELNDSLEALLTDVLSSVMDVLLQNTEGFEVPAE